MCNDPFFRLFFFRFLKRTSGPTPSTKGSSLERQHLLREVSPVLQEVQAEGAVGTQTGVWVKKKKTAAAPPQRIVAAGTRWPKSRVLGRSFRRIVPAARAWWFQLVQWPRRLNSPVLCECWCLTCCTWAAKITRAGGSCCYFLCVLLPDLRLPTNFVD